MNTNIRPSTALRNEYNEISAYCKEKGQPVFLTKNGEGDLVVMSIDAYNAREEWLNVREKLLEAEAALLACANQYTASEVSERLLGLIDGKI